MIYFVSLDNKTIYLSPDNKLIHKREDDNLCPILTVSFLLSNGSFSDEMQFDGNHSEFIKAFKKNNGLLVLRLKDNHGAFNFTADFNKKDRSSE